MTKKNTAGQRTEANNDSEQFQRFEDLTRRLFAVPKQEADKEREKKDRKKGR